MTASSNMGPRGSRTGHLPLPGSGTASPSRCGSASWRWRSRRRSCRRASWRCASPNREVFRLRGFGLPAAQGARPDHQPRLHRHQGGAEFKDKTTAPNQLWQTDFTYLKVIGWGWYYLSTVLDDFSRFIVAWKLCATMRADDVTATLDLALAASGSTRSRSLIDPGC